MTLYDDHVRVERTVGLRRAAHVDCVPGLNRIAAGIDHRAAMQMDRAIPVELHFQLHVVAAIKRNDAQRFGIVPAIDLARHADDTAAIDDIVWRIEDISRLEGSAVFIACQLVVGPSGNHPGA